MSPPTWRDSRVGHFVVLPTVDELALPRASVQASSSLSVCSLVSRSDGTSVPVAQDATEVSRMERLTRLAAFLHELDAQARAPVARLLDNPMLLLRAVKDEARLTELVRQVDPRVLDLLWDRPIINTLLCSEAGVEHRKELYYAWERAGLRFVGNGEVVVGRDRNFGPYRTDQLFHRRGRGAVLVEISRAVPPASEFSKKLRILDDALESGRQFLRLGHEEYAHLGRAWDCGDHAVAFYWGEHDLTHALAKFLDNPNLFHRTATYPYDVWLCTHEQEGRVAAWSVRAWLRNDPQEHHLREWRAHVPRAL